MIWGEGNIFDRIGRAIENLWTAVVGFFNGFGEFIGNIITAIGNVVSGIVNGIGAFFSTLWSWLGNIITAIGNIVGGIVNGILNGIGEVLRFLFVPTNNPFETLSNKINAKFGFVSQIGDLFSSLLGFTNYGDSVPTFNATWQGVTFGIVDFSLFVQYRSWIHGIILAIAWVVFIFRTYRKLPSIIGGFGQ